MSSSWKSSRLGRCAATICGWRAEGRRQRAGCAVVGEAACCANGWWAESSEDCHEPESGADEERRLGCACTELTHEGQQRHGGNFNYGAAPCSSSARG